MKRTSSSLPATALFASTGAALANPTGPDAFSGAASFAATEETLTVTSTAGAIINWRRFAITSDETMRFVQPAASSTVINRIGSAEFTVSGRIESNSH